MPYIESIKSVRTERMNVWVTPECRQWIKDESQRMAVPQGVVIEMAIEQLKSQRQLLEMIPKLVEVSEKLDRLEALAKRGQAAVVDPAQGDSVKAGQSEA